MLPSLFNCSLKTHFKRVTVWLHLAIANNQHTLLMLFLHTARSSSDGLFNRRKAPQLRRVPQVKCISIRFSLSCPTNATSTCSCFILPYSVFFIKTLGLHIKMIFVPISLNDQIMDSIRPIKTKVLSECFSFFALLYTLLYFRGKKNHCIL